MQRMIHKPLGGWTEAKEGQSATHILLDKEEYEALLKKIEEANQKAKLSEHDRQSSEEYIQILHKKRSEELAEAGRSIRVLEAQYKQKLEAAENKLVAVQRELVTTQEALEKMTSNHENLLRITRERSNAARKLQNKKKHSGYVVQYSRPVEYKWREVTEATKHMLKKEYEYKTATIWETTIQTPWPSITDIDTLRNLTSKDLLTEQQLTAELGMTGYQEGPAEKALAIPGNIIFKVDVRNNFQKNYWEVVVQHTKPITTVPEYMQPRKMQLEGQDPQQKPEPKKKKKKVERVKAAAPVEAKSVAPKEEEKKEEKKAFYDDTDEILRFLGILED